MPRSVSEADLSDHLDSLIELLREMVPKALHEFDEDAIHKSRVTTRRLKAAMELLGPVLTEDRQEPISKAGKRLRRGLGPLRDLDVMVGHLKEIKPDVRFHPAVEWLIKELDNQRTWLREKVVRKDLSDKVLNRLEEWPILREEIQSAESGTIGPLVTQAVHLQLDRFTEHANRLAQTDPHELRIAGKSLRYTLELAKAAGHKLPSRILAMFKRMQENLGTWHDHVVLAERAMKACIECDLPLHQPALQRQVLGLIDHCMKKAQTELERFGKLWQEKGPELSLAIREGIPLGDDSTPEPAAPAPSPEVAVAETATESKTDPDPAPTPEPEASAAVSEAAPPEA